MWGGVFLRGVAADTYEPTRGDRRWWALVALAAVTAVGEYVRWHLPSGDDKLAACRAIPPGASLTEIVAVLGQPVARQVADMADGAVWLEFSTPSIAGGRIQAAVQEPTGKVLALRCSADGPDTWAAKD
jgi:hypothetical protein